MMGRIRNIASRFLRGRSSSLWDHTSDSTPVELPEPVAALMTALLAEPRYRHNNAANTNSPWLFPGRNPCRPMHIGSIHTMLDATHVPLRTTWAGIWQQLVRKAPPAILAEAFGVKATTAMRYATTAGTDYLSYPRENAIERTHDPTPQPVNFQSCSVVGSGPATHHGRIRAVTSSQKTHSDQQV
jgi:hypothetical protein